MSNFGINWVLAVWVVVQLWGLKWVLVVWGDPSIGGRCLDVMTS